jgi:glycerophosphoryl diester phosphodiesterase
VSVSDGAAGRVIEDRTPLVIAHRGAWTAARPENSLAAFEAAIALGADMVEFDVRRTRDGALVIHHDPDHHGVPLGSLTRRELERMAGPAGAPPTLSEVVELVGPRIALDVELKEQGWEEEALALLAPLSPNRLLVSSFHDQVVRECKRLAPALDVGLILADPAPFPADGPTRRSLMDRLHRRLIACGADCVVAEMDLLDAGLGQLACAAQLRALGWTVNDPETLDRLMVESALAGVITDRPGLALSRRQAARRRSPDGPRPAGPGR